MLSSVVMLAKERHGELKKVDRKTYIQVTETRYKWTWLNSCLLIGSWESSGVASIHPLCKWYHTWLCHVGLVSSSDTLLTCIYGGGQVHYVGSTTSSNTCGWRFLSIGSKLWLWLLDNCLTAYNKWFLAYPTIQPEESSFDPGLLLAAKQVFLDK